MTRRPSGGARASGATAKVALEADSSPAPSRRSSSSAKGERRVRRRRIRKEEPPRRPWLLALIGVLGALVAAAAVYLLIVYPASAGPGSGKDVEITFERDEPTGSVVDKLARAGLVRSPGVFAIYVRLVAVRAAPGTHLLTDDASPYELGRRIEREGHASHAKVTIPEGWNRFDIAKRLQTLHVTWATAFLDATANTDLLRELGIDGESAEGLLFPATYELPLDSDPKEVVRRLVGEFDRRYLQLEQNHRLGHAQLESSFGWGRREIVTLASMVEKEAAVDDERPIIASVFLNRLRDPAFKKKVLQCDPTSGYGCLLLRDKVPACAGYTGKITHAINMDPANTYSTYVHEGLPPGPIGNPGIKSLQAVLAPSSTRYLYFVVRGDRHHAFSETIEDHNNAVKEYRERTSK